MIVLYGALIGAAAGYIINKDEWPQLGSGLQRGVVVGTCIGMVIALGAQWITSLLYRLT